MRLSHPFILPAGNLGPFGAIRAIVLVAASAVLALTLLGSPTRAAEIRLLSAAAMQSVFREIAGEFERTSGHRLIIDYATMGAIDQRVLRGETADLVIGSTPSISNLVKEGRLHADSQTTIGKVGVGIVVPSGPAKPRIASISSARFLPRSSSSMPIPFVAVPPGSMLRV